MALQPTPYIAEELRAGDTWFFELTYPDFPAGTWNCKVYLSSPEGTEEVTGTANGTAHRFTVAAGTTADYKRGGYNYQIRAEHASDGRVFTVGEGYLDILPPLSEQSDHRDRVKKILDAIDAVLEGRAESDHLSVSLAGRSISRMGVDELRDFRAWYWQQWETLKGRQQQKAFGRARSNNYKTRFRS